VAHTLWVKGFSTDDPVAAVPSLHVGGTVLFCIFMWSRLSRGWRFLLVGYPLVMMFSLAYAGEHYVSDGIAGALCAFFIHWAATRIERWHRARREKKAARAPDTLEAPPETTLESECPPNHPLQETTPSST
jgi:membrane-associated phospholipid phosphatase